jgi:hypothetical protein
MSDNTLEALKGGFCYTVEHLDAAGRVKRRDTYHNVCPFEGLAYIVDTAFGTRARIANWYIGLFSGAYTPVAQDTLASLVPAAPEFIGYDGATRKEFTPQGTPLTGGYIDNEGAKAAFTATEAATVYGAFLASSSGKGTTTGVLASAAQFDHPYVITVGDVLNVHAGFVLQSL